MRFLILCCVLFILADLTADVVCKRGRSRSRGGSKTSSSGDCGWFCSNSKKSDSSPRQPVPPPKPSAPHPDTAIKKQTVSNQQSSNVQSNIQSNPQSNAQRPIGWNVPGTNQNQNTQNSGWKSGYQSPGSSPHQQNSHSPVGQQPQGTAHQPQGAWPSPGQSPGAYPQQHGYQQQHAHQQQSAYPQQHGYPQQQGYPQQHGYPQQQGYPQQHGYPQQGYQGVGGYQGGYGPPGGYSGMGGYHGMGGGYPGTGGYHGGMGYPGMGGFGGMGGSPYGMYKKKSFFSGRTIANVMAGMFIYHMTSNLVSGLFGSSSSKRPVNVYNYYNQPAEAKEEIKLPSNILTLCEGNSTKLCTTGTTAICTTNNTVLCVVVMSQAQPCAEEKALCVNTSIPCLDPQNPICQNATQTQQKETPVSMPCFTNLTVDVNLLNETGSGQNADYKYCVTTMAVAGPEYKVCEDLDKISDYRSVLEENYAWNLTIHPMRRPYNVYNFKHPTETPSGDVVMPMEVLIPCIENATKLCVPGVTPICTTFSEIMCVENLASTVFCEKYNTTCITRKVACLENDPLCKDKKDEELVKEDDKTLLSIELPCFANVTVNSNLPNFDITTFNGTFPEGTNTSYTYHYHYCITTLGIPGPEANACLTTSDTKSST